MTKRFTPKASDYTVRMAAVQAKKAKLMKELRALEAEETALKAFLLPFYDEGKTVVDTGSKDLEVIYTVAQRQYLNQERAVEIILNMGKKVPYFTTDVTTFKVK